MIRENMSFFIAKWFQEGVSKVGVHWSFYGQLPVICI